MKICAIMFFIVLLISAQCESAEQSYVREYTYKASDLDSRVSARDNALKLIKSSVLEEIISFVSSSSEIGQKQAGDRFQSTYMHQVSSKSAGFLKAKIIKDNWNGHELWLKAEIIADPDKIREEITNALRLIPEVSERPLNVEATPIFKTSPGQQQNTSPDIQHKQSKHDSESIPVIDKKINLSDKLVSNKTETSPIIETSTVASTSDLPRQKLTPYLQHRESDQIVESVTPNYSGFAVAAKFYNVLSLITPIKLQLTMHYTARGEWPEELEQIGLSENDMSDGLYITNVNLGKNGKIITYLTKELGRDKLLILSPKHVMGGTSIRWDCTTNIKLHSNSLRCEYVKNL